MFKKTMKFVATTAILGICVLTLTYIYMLSSTISDYKNKAEIEKARDRKYTDIIVGGVGYSMESEDEVEYYFGDIEQYPKK